MAGSVAIMATTTSAAADTAAPTTTAAPSPLAANSFAYLLVVIFTPLMGLTVGLMVWYSLKYAYRMRKYKKGIAKSARAVDLVTAYHLSLRERIINFALHSWIGRLWTLFQVCVRGSLY